MMTVGSWTLLIEPNGYFGVTEERALLASAGASWGSHFVNINGVGTFLWAEDQVLRLCFDPMFPEYRLARRPTNSSTSCSGSTSTSTMTTRRRICPHRRRSLWLGT